MSACTDSAGERTPPTDTFSRVCPALVPCTSASWEWFCKVKAVRGEVDADSRGGWGVPVPHTSDYYQYYNIMFSAEHDDELRTKRGHTFVDALPRSRRWPLDVATNSTLRYECERDAPLEHIDLALYDPIDG